MANPSQPADHSVEAAEQLRVLVVDDHPLFREALKDLLQQDPDLEVCGEAADVRQALEQFQATGADLVTMDISLPSGNGIDVIKQIKRISSKAVVLVLSMHEDRTHAARALDAGALGYVSKQAAPQEILRAVHLVRAGRIYLSDEMAQRLPDHAKGSVQP